MKLICLMGLSCIIPLCSADRAFRNMSEEDLKVTLEYTDCQPSAVDIYIPRGEERHISNSCTLDKITVIKAKGGVATTFEDHDRGNVSYWLDKKYDFPSQISITKK